jgi:hypothetical protein
MHDKKIILLFQQRSGIEIMYKFDSASFAEFCAGMETIFKKRCGTGRRLPKKSN